MKNEKSPNNKTPQSTKTIETVLRERKDHFVVTIYRDDRLKLNIAVGDIIILDFGNSELVRPVRENFHVSLPKKLLKKKYHGDTICIPLKKIAKRSDCLFRPKQYILANKLDIRYFIPKETTHNYPLYVIKRTDSTSSIWFPIGGGVRHVTINNLVDIDRIAEFLGFYFGDGTKCSGIQSLRLTNCESSVLKHCLRLLEDIGIQRNRCKVQVIYSTPSDITQKIERRCIKFWSETLQMSERQIISVSKSHNVRETKKYGSARISIDSSVLVQVVVRGLMIKIIDRIRTPKTKEDYRMLKGFIRGLLAAEGCPEFNVRGSLVKVGIAYNPHSNELELYRKLLNNLRIEYGAVNRNMLYIYGFDNIRKFKEIDAFMMHPTRNNKFMEGFRRNSKSKL